MTSNSNLTKIGRLVMRVEGGDWVAYYALNDTMAGALRLGSIKMRFVEGHPARKMAYINMMREAVGDLVEDVTGCRTKWLDGLTPAPEHERAGSS